MLHSLKKVHIYNTCFTSRTLGSQELLVGLNSSFCWKFIKITIWSDCNFFRNSLLGLFISKEKSTEILELLWLDYELLNTKESTVIILIFGQIGLDKQCRPRSDLLEEQSDQFTNQGLHCLLFHLLLFDDIVGNTLVWAFCLNFR